MLMTKLRANKLLNIKKNISKSPSLLQKRSKNRNKYLSDKNYEEIKQETLELKE